MNLDYSELKKRREDSKQELFDNGRFENEWFSNIVDFVAWAWKDVEDEVENHFEKIGAKNIKSLTYTDVALQNKYGSFENAYEEYRKSFK